MIQLKKTITFLSLAILMAFISCTENENIADTPDVPDDNLIIEFKDNNLKERIKESQQITSKDISYGDIKNISSLSLEMCNDFGGKEDLTSLSGLENFTNLTYLKITNPCDVKLSYTDLTPLSKLSKLEHLELNYSSIDDLTPLTGLPNLKILKLQRSQITEISTIKELNKLTYLNLEESLIDNFSYIKDLSNLISLSLTSNDLKNDLDFLNGLSNLKKLELINCELSSIDTISNLKKLEEVNVALNDLSDLKSLCNLGSSFNGSINIQGNQMLKKADIDDLKSCLPQANILP